MPLLTCIVSPWLGEGNATRAARADAAMIVCTLQPNGANASAAALCKKFVAKMSCNGCVQKRLQEPSYLGDRAGELVTARLGRRVGAMRAGGPRAGAMRESDRRRAGVMRADGGQRAGTMRDEARRWPRRPWTPPSDPPGRHRNGWPQAAPRRDGCPAGVRIRCW